jgi:RNA polymerase sigma-70 factor (ECF subfamily)
MSRLTLNKRHSGSAVTTAFLEHNGLLKKFLSRFLAEQQDIEDVVQETYLRAYCAEEEQRIERPKAFLFRLAKNIALNELNRKSRQITDYIADFDLPLVIDYQETLEDELEARQHLGLFCEAIAALPEQRRRVFLLRKVHGLSHKEIARRMNLSVSSVEKHLLKGTLACRAYLREREESPPDAREAATQVSGQEGAE